MANRKDKLLVKEMGALNGEYVFDIIDLVNVGAPGSLNGHEAHLVKVKSGLRPAELEEALVAVDLDLFYVLSGIVLQRAGKRFDLDSFWDHAWGDRLSFELDTTEVEEEGDALPPEGEPPESEQTETHSQNGGESSSSTSDQPERPLSRIGPQDSETSATSAPQTSAS